MTVEFVISETNKVVVPNSVIVSNSEYIKSLMSDLNTQNLSIDVPVRLIPVFDIYIDFLNRNPRSINNIKQSIKSVSDILTCFDMESYFADNKFFKYLISQTYTMWDEFYPNISKLPDDRTVYLYTPYEFVPHKYMSNPVFFNRWVYINQNKYITLKRNNGLLAQRNEIHYTYTTYYSNERIKELDTYVIDPNDKSKKMGHRILKRWYDNG